MQPHEQRDLLRAVIDRDWDCALCEGVIPAGTVFHIDLDHDGRIIHVECPRPWTPVVVHGDAERPFQRPLDLVGLTIVPDPPRRSTASHPSNRRRP